MNERQTQVLIIGAGPVGLSLAIELGQRGVRCIVIERNDRVGYAPRAKTTNVRTKEHMRRWGIAENLRAASPFGVHYPSNVVFSTRLSGYALTRFDNAFYCAPGRNPLYSEHAQWIPQYAVEEVLRAHAESLPSVTIRLNQEFDCFDQDEAGVRAQVRDLSGETTYTIDSEYLVGADGARSTVREAIGAKMHGTYAISRHYNIVFHAPGLADAHPHGPAIMYWQVNADVPSVIGPMDCGDKWFFMPTALTDTAKLSDQDAVALICKATGIERDYKILSSDQWVASRLMADRYRLGRVFLAGDACHLHPPFGGYGMNMGISDGVDLGWKMAATLEGWGGPALLDSYEDERRPVHSYVMDEAVANHAILSNHLLADGIEDAGERGVQVRRDIAARIQAAKTREFNTLGVVLGYRYDQSPIIVDDRSRPRAQDFLNYVPSSRPGCLAPHAWLHDGTSLYDHFGDGYTLITHGSSAAANGARAASTANEAGVPMKVLSPREPVISDLYEFPCTLIRPDQHVAWRGDVWPQNGRSLLDRITGRTPAQHRAIQPASA